MANYRLPMSPWWFPIQSTLTATIYIVLPPKHCWNQRFEIHISPENGSLLNLKHLSDCWFLSALFLNSGEFEEVFIWFQRNSSLRLVHIKHPLNKTLVFIGNFHWIGTIEMGCFIWTGITINHQLKIRSIGHDSPNPNHIISHHHFGEVGVRSL